MRYICKIYKNKKLIKEHKFNDNLWTRIDNISITIHGNKMNMDVEEYLNYYVCDFKFNKPIELCGLKILIERI